MILDGELVVRTAAGEADFTALMERLHPAASRVAMLSEKAPAELVVFDVLAIGDRNLMTAPYAERRAALSQLMTDAPPRLRLTPCSADSTEARGWLQCLEALGLAGYPKTSGGKGIHVYVPVRDATYDDTKLLARTLAARLSSRHPELVVDRLTRTLRFGRVLVDWSQNDPGKTTVAPWSVRAYALPTVSMPLTWGEVENAVGSGRLPDALAYVPGRLEKYGDLFAPVLTDGGSLAQTVQMLDAAR